MNKREEVKKRLWDIIKKHKTKTDIIVSEILVDPDIYIKAPEQKPPVFLTPDGLTEMELVNATRKSMIDDNWLKVLPQREGQS